MSPFLIGIIMATKVKVNDLVHKIKKYGALLPVFLVLPYFFQNPSISKVNFLMIVIVFYFICFMGPLYLLKFLISKVDLNQKIVDFLSVVSCFIMYIWTSFNWANLFLGNIEMEFATALFIIPFIAMIRSSQFILFVVCLLFLNNYLKSKLKTDN